MATISENFLMRDTAGKDRNGSRTYNRLYRVKMSGPSSSGELLLNNGSLPDHNDAHPDDSDAVVVNVNVTKVDDSLEVFDYEVDYSSDRERLDTENPLDELPRVDWNTTDTEQPYFVDQNGNQVVNSVGQQFAQQPTRYDADWELIVTVNRPDFNISQATDAIRTVNSTTLRVTDGTSTWSVAADLALLVEYNPSELKIKNGVEYYEIRFRWKLLAAGWNTSEKYLDYGTFEKDGTDWKPVVDSAGNDIVEQFPLDGSGNRQPVGTDAAELSFTPYATYNHNSLPIQ